MHVARLVVMTALLSFGAAWAGLMPFQIINGVAVPVNQDSVTMYEVSVQSDPTGNLLWHFRLGASPSETITLWVGFPGAGDLIAEGNPSVEPASMLADVMLPGEVKKKPMKLYQIEFPGDRITLLSLRTTSPNPWNKAEKLGLGEYETWRASLTMDDLARWAGTVDRAKVMIDLPGELKSLWLDDPKKFQITAIPSSLETEDGSIQWEFRNWEPTGTLAVQVSAYRPFEKEADLLDPPAFMLPLDYQGDKIVYPDSLLNGYLWMPEFNRMGTSAERGIFARAYLWIRQNEILARHGFEFKGEDALRTYFEKQPWYKPDPKFKTEMLSSVEMQNFWKLINRRAEFQPHHPESDR